MTDDEMREFPKKLGEAGFVFNFITYGGHQIDGVAAEEFATALLAGRHAGPGSGPTEDPPARVALPNAADPRRRSSPRRRLGGIVGAHRDDESHGQGLDAGPAPGTNRAPQEGARGLARRVESRSTASRSPSRYACARAATAPTCSNCRCWAPAATTTERPTSSSLRSTDRHGQVILSVRDQNTFDSELRQKRLMTLLHLYVLKRYRVITVHYVTPTEDNDNQTKRMAEQGIYSNVEHRGGPDHRRQGQPRPGACAPGSGQGSPGETHPEGELSTARRGHPIGTAQAGRGFAPNRLRGPRRSAGGGVLDAAATP